MGGAGRGRGGGRRSPGLADGGGQDGCVAHGGHSAAVGEAGQLARVQAESSAGKEVNSCRLCPNLGSLTSSTSPVGQRHLRFPNRPFPARGLEGPSRQAKRLPRQPAPAVHAPPPQRPHEGRPRAGLRHGRAGEVEGRRETQDTQHML